MRADLSSNCADVLVFIQDPPNDLSFEVIRQIFFTFGDVSTSNPQIVRCVIIPFFSGKISEC